MSASPKNSKTSAKSFFSAIRTAYASFCLHKISVNPHKFNNVSDLTSLPATSKPFQNAFTSASGPKIECEAVPLRLGELRPKLRPMHRIAVLSRPKRYTNDCVIYATAMNFSSDIKYAPYHQPVSPAAIASRISIASYFCACDNNSRTFSASFSVKFQHWYWLSPVISIVSLSLIDLETLRF